MKTTSFQIDVAGCELVHQRYSPGHATPWHRHQTAELCFLSGGAFTEFCRGRTMRYPRFGLGLKPAGLAHRVQVEKPGASCWVVSVPAASLPDLHLEPRWFGELKLFDTRDLAHLCTQATEEIAHPDRCTALILQGLTLELIGRVARLQHPPVRAQPPSWLSRVEERLREEWNRRPTLASLAAEAGVAPAVMAAAFRRKHGCTVGEFLRRLQVERARLLLMDPSLSLAQAGASSGFYDQSHFTKLFLRYVGTTPAHYRRELCR